MRFSLAILALLLATCGAPRPQPLWPGARYTTADRDAAVRRGLDFVIKMARDHQVFEDYAPDLLFALHNIADTSADRELRRIAFEASRERAREYRRLHPALPPEPDAPMLAVLAYGSWAADNIGIPDPAAKKAIAAAAKRFNAVDFLGFDPFREPPPSDIPEPCAKCGKDNPRGSAVCRFDGSKLELRSRYDVWCDALIATYVGDRYGVTLGAPHAVVAKWAAAMRPYRRRAGNPEFTDVFYGVSHLVYTLNDYSRVKLSPPCMPAEFAFLRDALTDAIDAGDAEMLGEFLDSLRSFGMTANDAIIRAGFEYLLSHQNADGSWGDVNEPDAYDRYHPTWTALDGLREYRWKEVRCPSIL